MGTWKKAILEGDSALLPTGGTTGQVLAKNSGTNYDVAWTTAGGGATINNNTNDYLVTATGTANTLNGEANLTFNGSLLTVTAKIRQSAGGNSSVIIGVDAGTYTYSNGYGDVIIGPYSDTVFSYTGNGVAIGPTAIVGESGVSIGSSTKNYGYGVSLGPNAGQNSTGQYMIAIGREAGKAATANSNVYIGDLSGRAVTSGVSNVAVGSSALGSATATTASRNIAIGNSALVGTTTGGDNICIGNRAGEGTTTTSSSILIGTEAGKDNNVQRIAIGDGALTRSSGGQCTAVGHRTGNWATTGARNTYMGHSSGFTWSGSGTGSNNTGIGYFALYSITSGAQNTAVGASALDAVNTGGYNVAIGYDALGTSQTGGNNVAVGVSALGRNTGSTGSNTAVGTYSLYGAAASQAFGNCALGYGTFYNISSGYNNVAIGYQAGYSLTTGAANVFVGHNAGYNETGSNKLYIANSNTSTPLVYGEFDNNLLRFRNRVEIVGAGATSATTSLLIQDSASASLLTIRDDGGFAFKGGTVGVAQTGYTTPTNLTTDRTFDADATTIDELADVLGTLIEDLKTKGIIAA